MRGFLGMLLLLAIFTAGAVGCDGTLKLIGVGNSGTTPGVYVVTISGAGGTATASGTVTINVE
jgi:hypothetical protein